MKNIFNIRFWTNFISGNSKNALTLKQVQKLMAVSIGLNHVVLLAVFAIFQVRFMVAFNIISIMIYALAYYLVETDHSWLTFHLICYEVVLHMCFAVIMVGRDCGFEFYCFSMVVVYYYGCYVLWTNESNRKLNPIPAILVAICAWILTQLWSVRHAPYYEFGDTTAHLAVMIMNFVFAMSAMFLFISCYFNNMIMLEDALKVQNRLLEEASLTDELMQIGNRRCAENYIHSNESRSDRFALTIADIDGFKQINDTFGHINGDIALIQLANCFKEMLRINDKLFRWGGEEFLIVMPDLTLDEAVEAVERMRTTISSMPIVFDGKTIHITLTFGVASTQEERSIQRLIELADKYLYMGKQFGKNIVVSRDTNISDGNAISSRRVQEKINIGISEPQADDVLQNPIFAAFANAADNVYIYVCNMETGVSRWSNNAVKYFDMPGEFFADAANLWMKKIHPDDRDRYFIDIDSVFSGRQVRHHCQYRAINRYGDYVWLECKGSVFHDKSGKQNIFAGMMTRIDNQSKYDALTGAKTVYELNNVDFRTFAGIGLLVGIFEFRRIVNTKGFAYGNYLIKKFAVRLMSLEGKGIQVYRFRDVEFLILLPKGTRKSASKLFQEIVGMGVDLEDGSQQETQLDICGGAVICPNDGAEQGEVLSNLEHSLEYAMELGKGTLSFFTQNIAQKHIRENLIKAELTSSIRNDFRGFSLYYQPIVENREGHRIISCEALLRWKTDLVPDSGPGEFIKVLERTGEIREVGLFVARETIKTASQLQKYGISLSFNVSSVQLRDERLARYIIEEARIVGVKSENLIIELTESAKVEQPERLANTFQFLRKNGFRIALDDFGTENSSISLISVLPADILKVDQSFVKKYASLKGPTDRAIIEAIVSLAKNLQLQVVAEGIETKETEQLLGAFAVDYLQGYFYAKPMPLDELISMLS